MDLTDQDPNALHELSASLQLIGINVRAHYEGSPHAYRGVATELRKLLFDRQRGKDIALLPRVFPNIHLHGLPGQDRMEENTVLYLPFRLRFGPEGDDIDHMFVEPGPGFPLDEWGEQFLFNRKTTLREFVRAVADKESAHSDRDKGQTLGFSHSVMLGNASLTDKAVVAIARYVVRTIAWHAMLLDANQAAIRKRAAEHGRGLVMFELHDYCAGRLTEMPYVTFDSHIAAMAKDSPAELLDQMRQMYGEYDPDTEFLLVLGDLNGRGRTFLRMNFVKSR